MADWTQTLGALAAGDVTVEVESALSPPVRLSLAELRAGGPPGPLLRLFRPQAVVRLGGAEVARLAPAGSPSRGARLVLWAAGGALALGLLYLAARGLGR